MNGTEPTANLHRRQGRRVMPGWLPLAWVAALALVLPVLDSISASIGGAP